MRLLIIEYDNRAAAVLSSVLRRHGFGVFRARTVAQALESLRARPDLVIVAPDLPDGDGLEICDSVRRSSDAPVIVVAAPAGPSARIQGLYRGADDYLERPFDPQELLARIHAVIRRSGRKPAVRPSSSAAEGPERAADLPAIQVRGVRIDLGGREVAVAGHSIPLTRKEFDLLARLARAPGVVFRREQLLSEIWGLPPSVSSRTLDVHVSSLRGKLGEPSIVQTVRGVGYRFRVPTG